MLFSCSRAALIRWWWPIAVCSVASVAIAPAAAQTISPAADGTGTIVSPTDGGAITITGGQHSGDGRNLFHSFQEFGLRAGEAAIFQTTGAIENVLGRVVGGDASMINGQVAIAGSAADLYLINPAGIVFGDRASLNVPGDFVVTSADAIGFGDGAWWSATRAANWSQLNGDPSSFAFRLTEPGVILNAGTLAIAPGQNFSAIGGVIANTGTLAAPAGTVTTLAVAGERWVRLSLPGNVLSLDVVAIVPSATATNLPRAATLPQLLTGQPELQTASQLTVNPDGTVSLRGSTQGITTEPGTVLLSGTIDVANDIAVDRGTGQQATVLGDRLAVLDATIDASGVAGGGTVLLGGELQGNGSLPNAAVLYFDETSRVSADAWGRGDGGTVILWADGMTVANGAIAARGEQGGFVEVSGKETLRFDGAIDTSGTRPEQNGTVLFDPDDLTLSGEPDPPPEEEPTPEPERISTGNSDSTPPADNTSPPPETTTINGETREPLPPKPALENTAIITIDDGSRDVLGGIEAPLDTVPPTDSLTAETDDGGIVPRPLEDSLTNRREEPTASVPPEDSPDGAVGEPLDDRTTSTEFDTDEFDTAPGESSDDPPPIKPVEGRFDSTLPDDLNNTDDVHNLDADFDHKVFNDSLDNLTDDSTNIAIEAEIDAIDNTVERLIIPQNGNHRPLLDENISEITTEQLQNVTGDLVFQTEGSLTIDRPIVRNSSIVFQAGNTLAVNAPIATVGLGSSVTLNSGNNLDINANIDTSQSNGNITISANDSGIQTDSSQPALFAIDGVAIAQAPGTTINAGSGNIVMSLDGSEVSDITLGNISTSGTITVDANGGNILRLNPTSVIDASTGTFTTTGVGQIGEANNPLVVNIARLTTNTDSGRVFVNDINRSAIEDNTRHFAQEATRQEAAPDNPPPPDNELKMEDGNFEMESDVEEGGDLDEDEAGEYGESEVGEYGEYASAGSWPDIAVEFAAIEQDRVQEFGRFLGDRFGDRNTSARSAREALAAIAQQTGSQTAAIYVTLLPDRVDLLVFSSNGEPLRRSVEVDPATLTAAVTELRYAVTNPRARLRGSTRHQVIGQQLYNWLVAPIAADLEANNIDTLVFSMPAGLRGLPIAAMHTGTGYLVEDYSLGLIPSLALVDTRYQSLDNTELLAMGASEFDNLSALPAVPLELNTITSSLWQGTTLLNESFTRSNITRTRDRNPYPIIHLATHGEFGSGESGSFIQLWDERLRLNQIRELGWNDPPVELLVLSACRTAVGDEEAELGFAGFAIAAGVKSALASLWYVSDVGTLTLMTQFYQQLSATGLKAEALRQAQLALIHNEFELLESGEIYFPSFDRSFPLPEGTKESEIAMLSHPYYWSAFTMIGSPW